ncbi:MAG TPA: energy transducer TonB, partial [Bryobacteraceae bacterium]|nr:energy transducer TonB [Bryobacteraceae bacterium]
LISALAAGAALLAGTCWFVTGAIPLAASPQLVADAPGVAVNLEGAQWMHRTSVAYPGEAALKGIQGTVVVQVKLDANGEVTDAAVQSGPDELRKPVIQSVLDWHFMKDSAGTTRTISVQFTAPPTPPAPTPARTEVILRGVAPITANNSAWTLTKIEVTGLSDEAKSDLLAQLPVHVGDSVTPDQFGPILEAVRKFDSHLTVIFPSNPNITSSEMVLRISAPGTRGVVGGFSGGVIGGIVASTPRAQDAAPAPNGPRIMVGGGVQANKLAIQSTPVYPPLAKQARISGTVELSAVIGKDGHVMNLSVIKGHPLLVQSALDAVKDWVYQPTLLNGQPVEVSTTIDVNFTLAQ